jgi:glutamine synthetase
MAHSAALTALVAPTVNSYKRLRLGASLSGSTWAPPYLAQGPNNRTAALRTLHGRFEWRVPDSSTNVYLATAALIAAGMDGVDRKLEPPPECTEDLFGLSPTEVHERGIPLLPQSLAEALDALAADELVCTALGATLAEEFLHLKRAEVAEYQQQVSDWEMRRYAEAF